MLTGAILAAAAALWIVGSYHPWLIENDGSQYISIARNLLDGHGNASSTLMYESQLRTGLLPSPQTVWPPGFPAAIALLMKLGVDPGWAGFLLSLLAWGVIWTLTFKLLRRAGASAGTGMLGACLWALTAIDVDHVLGSYSDLTFTCLTVCAAWYWAYASRAAGFSAAAMAGFGIFASLAILVRYAGLFFFAAAAAHTLLAFPLTRNFQLFKQRLCALILPALTIAGLFTYVYTTIGSLDRSGDPMVFRSVTAAAKSVYWGFRDIFGMTLNFSPKEPPLRWLAGIGLTLGIAGAAILRLRSAQLPAAAACRPETHAMLGFALLVVGANIAGLFSQALWTDAFLPRFLLPTLPFLILLLFAPGGLFDFGAAAPRLRLAVAALCGLGFLCGQFQAYGELLPQLKARQPRTDLEAALDVSTGRESLRAHLLRRGPILANQSQRLNLALDRPTIGLPTGAFSRRDWSDAQIQRLAACYHVGSLVIFKHSYAQDIETEPDTRIVLFDALLRGESHPWLTPVVNTPAVSAYDITGPDLPTCK